MAQRLELEGCKVCLENEIDELISLARQLSARWVILDGYGFTQDDRQQIMDSGQRLLILNDLGLDEQRPADIVLNQNLHADASMYRHCGTDVRLLLGLDYLLLRKEFWPWIGRNREIPGRARRVLVTMGGSDPTRLTEKVLAALGGMATTDVCAKVVIGPANPRQHEICAQARQIPIDTHVVQNATDMSALLAEADLCLVSGGAVVWEAALLGLPGLGLSCGRQETMLLQRAERQGIMRFLGTGAEVSESQIARETHRLIENDQLRHSMCLAGQRNVDGKGVHRVLSAM
jgi:spore coat polysaccharide biosynthesis predicted glycosyltransferase SpsG